MSVKPLAMQRRLYQVGRLRHTRTVQRRALISVSDKSRIEECAHRLSELGFEILSTGGTREVIEAGGVSVTPVEKITGFPECFSGRLKTLHPLLLGGILMRREEDTREAQQLGISPIDIVITNLYPFKEAALRGARKEELTEHIDIGGVTLLRAAAKNARSVTVVCDSADYERVLLELEEHGDVPLTLREELAQKAFQHTASYDALIAKMRTESPEEVLQLSRIQELRYGENPHQHGWYASPHGEEKDWVLRQGKPLSYCNLLDADAAWRLVQEFEEPTAALIKHANPCGVATHKDIAEAFQRGYDADRLSAFGVVIALNRTCPQEIVEKILEQKIFVDVLLAPSFEEGALEILKEKPNIRAIEILKDPRKFRTYRSALGGFLIQDDDRSYVTQEDLTYMTKVRPTQRQLYDLLFAWNVAKHTKSNAIVFAKDLVTVGIGAGQTSRIDATWIAAKHAGKRTKGACMASDAFFPFPDSIEEAHKNGIAAIIQPGGSIRDEEVIKKADELGIAMVTTGVRVFRH
jgi:phosphoribosylaminoimidazolecarboxamide formyltransferase / IMP cyclohydrolase